MHSFTKDKPNDPKTLAQPYEHVFYETPNKMVEVRAKDWTNRWTRAQRALRAQRKGSLPLRRQALKETATAEQAAKEAAQARVATAMRELAESRATAAAHAQELSAQREQMRALRHERDAAQSQVIPWWLRRLARTWEGLRAMCQGGHSVHPLQSLGSSGPG